MDPVTTAMVAAVAKLAEPAVRDAYDALKRLVMRRFGSTSDVTTALQKLEEQPESAGRRQVLVEEVARTGAANDAEIIAAAQELAGRVAALPGSTTTIQQTVTGNYNVVAGRDANVTQQQV